MPARYRIAYLTHSVQSDWNNGNAHFLRGLLRAMGTLGHEVIIFEAHHNWSIENLRTEGDGEESIRLFHSSYPDLKVKQYRPEEADERWRERLNGFEVVILHEWNSPTLAAMMIRLRKLLDFSLFFHDTHHRATSSPEQMTRFGLSSFDGVIAFGAALQQIYQQQYKLSRVWVLHEAADTTVFKPIAGRDKSLDVVWIGNWGEGERTDEICEYLLEPVGALQPHVRSRIYGVRYPESGLHKLRNAGIQYGGYLANLDAPEVYASACLTVHVPRQQYSAGIEGIPTIRVFEALACGIPLLSAPWRDTERLFREDDFCMVSNGAEMQKAIRTMLADPERAADQAARGLETIMTRHRCVHRAQELTAILEEVRS